MKLGIVATVVGIVAGLLSAVYTCTNLYEKLSVRNKTGDTHIALTSKTPLIAQTIEVHPDSAMAVKVDVSYKIYETGDIIIESGKIVKLLPFDLTFQQALADSLISTAYAQDPNTAGARYKVKIIKYIESSRKMPSNMIEETKTYGDGTQEVKLVDPRSGSVVESTQIKIQLSPQQMQQINHSSYNKMIYTQQSTTR
jgi:hypothetical protein